ncbi:uncharacterized protein LOC132638831 [Lycium barbarum]|uniref:uncharacterized protein LOC132638831 n=1 Tax=Lycium barbarum TaxID=112863 RepID=UPI00293EE65D|nr:uncharacterized protein LOC132638831 [Lycium barbarum]
MEMEKQKEDDHQHIDKKQKTTDNQQQQQDVEATKAVKVAHKKKLKLKKDDASGSFFGLKPLDILIDPPACYCKAGLSKEEYEEEHRRLIERQRSKNWLFN